MPAIARKNDRIKGGEHCHGHPHAPPATPGRIVRTPAKVYAFGRPVAVEGDLGYSPFCCGGKGKITVGSSGSKVKVRGKTVATVGTETSHCDDMGQGTVETGDGRIRVSK